jgi:hypothetical protein
MTCTVATARSRTDAKAGWGAVAAARASIGPITGQL